MRGSVTERINAHSRRDLRTGCLIWTGARHERGYGLIWHDGRARRVTHVVLELAGIKLAPDEKALHECDNPPCIERTHLHPGTLRMNALECVARKRHRNSRKTHCLNGHRFTKASTRVRTYHGRTWRECLTCSRSSR